MSSPNTAFSLEHALLYCIGVNLPSYKIGQLDRVLVLASPINDVNLYAWNLNRVTLFMVTEAGIQMELCSVCMGHRRNIVTFLMPPRIKKDCMSFLLKEMLIPDNPERLTESGPIYYYSVPHRCGNVPPVPPPRPPMYTPRGSLIQPSEPFYYNEAEIAVLSNMHKQTPPRTPLHPKAPPPPPPPPPSPPPSHSLTPPPSHSPPPPPPHTPPLPPAYQDIESSTPARKKPPPLPPRTVSRGANYTKNASALVQPYLHWTSHTTCEFSRLPSFSSSHTDETDDKSFVTTPYQISHRIYITDSGQVKYEPQVLGSGGGEVRRRKKHKPPPLPPREVIKLAPPRSQQVRTDVSSTQRPGPPAASFRSPKQHRSASTKVRSLSESEKMTSEYPYHYARNYSTEEGEKTSFSAPPPIPPKERSQSSDDSNWTNCLPPFSPSPSPSQQQVPQPKPRSRTVCSTISVRHNQSSPQLTRKASVKPPVPLPRKKTITKKDSKSHSVNTSPVAQRRMQRSLSSGSVSSDEYMRINVCYKINDFSNGNQVIYNNI